MPSMNWKTLIQDLLNTGRTQAEIAAKIGVSQPSIVDLLQSKTKSVRWEVGNELIKFHKKVMRKAA